jgi:hypothetical protein
MPRSIFLRYPISANTLFDNYSTIYLINSKDLLKLRSFVKALFDKYIKARSLSLLASNTALE